RARRGEDGGERPAGGGSERWLALLPRLLGRGALGQPLSEPAAGGGRRHRGRRAGARPRGRGRGAVPLVLASLAPQQRELLNGRGRARELAAELLGAGDERGPGDDA